MEKVSSENKKQYAKLKLLSLILMIIASAFYFVNQIRKSGETPIRMLSVCLIAVLTFMFIKDLIVFCKDYKKGIVEFVKPHTVDSMSLILASSCLLLNLLEFLRFV